MDWSDDARKVIGKVHLSLPEDATFEERKKAVDAAYPFGVRQYWPYKAWLKARKAYLSKYGAIYPQKPTALDLLPRDPVTGRPVI